MRSNEGRAHPPIQSTSQRPVSLIPLPLLPLLFVCLPFVALHPPTPDPIRSIQFQASIPFPSPSPSPSTIFPCLFPIFSFIQIHRNLISISSPIFFSQRRHVPPPIFAAIHGPAPPSLPPSIPPSQPPSPHQHHHLKANHQFASSAAGEHVSIRNCRQANMAGPGMASPAGTVPDPNQAAFFPTPSLGMVILAPILSSKKPAPFCS